MSTSTTEALSRVPLNVPNRESLARLLVTVEAARADLAQNAVEAEWHRRLYQVADLLLLADATPGEAKVRRRVASAINSTRHFAYRHGCKPSTIRGIRAEARLIAATLR